MRFDVVILGGSFAGSLLGMILARHGMRVALLDRDRHPRFAIGESSTPIADLTLGRLADRWRLPEIAPLARWGTWRRTYPDIGCGLKRGFSYFRHEPGRAFTDTPDHDASLLVAASATEAEADTHWLRADVDAMLFRQARAAGVVGREGCAVTALDRDRDGWRLTWTDGAGAVERARADVVIDGTGGGGVLGRVLGLGRLDDALATRTGAIYGHFAGVESWDGLQEEAGNRSTTWPYRSDDAAQHHLLEGGWLWMLRFADGRTSVGLVATDVGAADTADPTGAWRRRLAPYPSLGRLLGRARPLRPLAAIPRMSRLWDRASGPGWALLPTTAGLVDPLHSTGIAHALSGVARLADLLLAPASDDMAWLAYGRDVVDEVVWIDRLVSTALAVLDDFPLFTLACHLYFTATIRCERSVAADGGGSGFLAARDTALRAALDACCDDLRRAAADGTARTEVAAVVARRLQAWDEAGLFDPLARNRFAHTVAAKGATGGGRE